MALGKRKGREEPEADYPKRARLPTSPDLEEARQLVDEMVDVPAPQPDPPGMTDQEVAETWDLVDEPTFTPAQAPQPVPQPTPQPAPRAPVQVQTQPQSLLQEPQLDIRVREMETDEGRPRDRSTWTGSSWTRPINQVITERSTRRGYFTLKEPDQLAYNYNIDHNLGFVEFNFRDPVRTNWIRKIKLEMWMGKRGGFYFRHPDTGRVVRVPWLHEWLRGRSGKGQIRNKETYKSLPRTRVNEIRPSVIEKNQAARDPRAAPFLGETVRNMARQESTRARAVNWNNPVAREIERQLIARQNLPGLRDWREERRKEKEKQAEQEAQQQEMAEG